MWRLVAVAGILCFACRDESRSLPSLSAAEHWLRTEQFREVLRHSDEWSRNAERSHDPKQIWDVRLIVADAMLGSAANPETVLRLLASAPPVPDSPEWAAIRARRLYLQARASYAAGQDGALPALFDSATRAAAAAHRPELAAEVDLRRGFAAADRGDYAEADRLYLQVSDEARRRNDRYLEARARNSQGQLLQSESRYDEAIPVLEAARSLALQAGAPETAARALGNLGLCYFRLGDYDNASPRLTAARDEFRRAGNNLEVQIWAGALGNVLYETQDYREAQHAYDAALAMARTVNAPVWEGRWLSNLASTAIEQSDWDAAENYNNEATRIKEQTNDVAYRASSLINAGKIASGRGDLTAAIRFFAEALRKGAEDPSVALDAHAGLAEVYARMGRLSDAEKEFRNTITEIESRQSRLFKDEYRLSWLDSLIRFYDAYVDFLVDQNQPERALEAAESSRSKVLTGNRAPSAPAPDYRQLARRTNSVLVEYWLAEKNSYLWTITPERIVLHRLPPNGRLLPLIRNYRAVTTAGRNPLEVADATGGELYEALLAPAVRDSGMRSRFIVVPDDEIYSLNLETLPDGNSSSHYWIEHATIRISPSLNYLASNAPHAAPRVTPRMLVIGDPDSSLPQFPKLEFAKQEISSIVSAMSTARPAVVEGAAATPASYAASKPGDFGFIHFSAHAEAAAKTASALDSAVILSGPPDRCRLAARDVVSIPLKAELVTVSACRSAGGKTYGGEGLVGFAWAFMKAGAGNVIAGLWDVNDRSTVELMSRLYSGIAAGMPPADALREAKLALIRGGGAYAKPFYWAPFQVYTARVN
ncbi:MAG: CHAT domain-containing protein [Acidobacteriota bacterium]|nr:CHAT domain-containing protein [Acidobacteriota bacterium]